MQRSLFQKNIDVNSRRHKRTSAKQPTDELFAKSLAPWKEGCQIDYLS